MQICTFILEKGFTKTRGAPDLPQFRLVDMYLSCTEQAVKEEIMQVILTGE